MYFAYERKVTKQTISLTIPTCSIRSIPLLFSRKR